MVFVILLLNLSFMSAQQQERAKLILFQGVVMDAASLEPLPNTHFILNKAVGNVTDEKGEFSLYIEKDDTIKFSHVGYRDFIYTPSDTLRGNAFTAGILFFSKGLPEKPEPPRPMIPQKDIERMKELYRERINKDMLNR